LCNFGQLQIPKTSAELGLEQRFFLNESLNNKLFEYEAIFEQLFKKSYSTLNKLIFEKIQQII